MASSGYANYQASALLKKALQQDAQLRFSRMKLDGALSTEMAQRAVHFIEEVARARSVVRF